MGFTTGFLGGITLTTTLIYLSLAVHERTRLRQAELLRQQALILNNAVSPAGLPASTTARTAIPGLQERLRDRWNAELEGNLRKVYAVNWRGVREELEDRVAGVWGRAMAGTREGVETGVEKVKEVKP
ncbi:hypothetical protein K461DRAFT_293332 [Myriangium duriaei CBS 260.36]|uniref:MICOS complex subunit MIC12 n=1 Tax=Myriangium duriaei CBS 260.36 TaxID=1168546 RepID=A0A9P4J2S2_9PEZI|nr:hypothetical protein K461DRAFT_293332 [Myriangium duriaei CBS 260.36]